MTWRHTTRVVAVLLALLVGVTGQVSFSILAESAERYRAANTAADLDQDVSGLIGASWDLVRPEADFDAASAAVTHFAAEVRREAAALGRSGFESDDVEPLAARAVTLARSVEAERLLAAENRRDEAEALARTHEGTSAVLSARIVWLTAELRREAARGAGLVRLEIVGLSGLVVVIVSTLLTWDGRRRRRIEADAVSATAAISAQRALRESEAGFRLLFERNPHPMWVFDRETLRFLEVNTAAVKQYGWSREEFLAMTIVDIRPPEDVAKLHEWLRTAPEGLRHGGAMRHRTKPGGTIDVEMSSHTLEFGGRPAVLATAQDVTDRLHAERALVHRTMHDSLTGLANRSVLVDRLEQAVSRCDRPEEQVAVIFINLDRFKVINDGKGRAAADSLLVEVGARMRGAVRPGSTVARFGGDEFVVLLQGVADEAEARAACDRIGWALDAPFHIDDSDLFVSVSQGIAVAAPGESADVVLSRADAGMRRAKEGGGARVEFVDEVARTSTSNRLDLESSLRRAIDNEEFVLHYQPVVRLDTGEIVGAEALVRWQHPERGLLAPDQFIAAAEESGLIVPLGDWVLRQAIEDARWWTPSNPDSPPLSIAVNVSTIQLRVPNLPFSVARLLSSSGVDPSRLHLEITESVLVRDLERSSQVLIALRALGVQVDVDDFGTGYSSLTYVQRLPIDALKIDKSFVDGLDGPFEDSSIVEAVINLARSLKVAVVAEGVETDHQRAVLRRLGCEFAQGYHFARPVPLADFTELLRSGPMAAESVSLR